MKDVYFIGEPKVGSRQGWVVFLVVNFVLLGGCLWAAGSYNDWVGDDHLRSGEVVTPSERVVLRLIASLILVVLFGITFCPLHRWVSWTRWIIGSLMLLGLIAGLFDGTSYMFGVSAMLLVAFLVAFCTSIFLPLIRSWGFAIAMVAIASGTILAQHVSLPRHQSLIEARNAFPFEDISSRLEYESNVIRNVAFPGESVSNGVVVDAERLDETYAPNAEAERAAIRRNARLANFHDAEYERFIRAEGFGVRRIIYPHKGQGELPPLRDISIDEKLDTATSDNDAGVYLLRSIDANKTDANVPVPIDKYYLRSLDDFLNPITFGFVRSRQIVAGFQPHAFHIPIVPENQPDDSPKLVNLQLVSLLRFDSPQVYELDHLPRMDQLSSNDFETRALDKFEDDALMRLKAGEETVIESMDATIRMLGAIRARNECLNCHSVEDGALLGAFTYRFANPSPTRLKVGEQ